MLLERGFRLELKLPGWMPSVLPTTLSPHVNARYLLDAVTNIKTENCLAWRNPKATKEAQNL